jgi:cysteine desulfurase
MSVVLLFHTDAAQSVGKLAVDVHALGVDLLTLVEHEMYAPKGIGALYLRRGLRLQPLLEGGGQEQNLRAATENVARCSQFGPGHDAGARGSRNCHTEWLAGLRDRLHAALVERLSDRVHLNGHLTLRLSQVLNVSIEHTPRPRCLERVSVAGHINRVGLPCRSSQPPHRCAGDGMPTGRCQHAGFSLGRWSTAADVDYAADVLTAAASRE